jgi:hypothetical protein
MDERARATNDNFIKVVRLVKYLRDYKDTFTCVSIILTTLLGQEVDPIEAQMNPDLYKDVPTTLKTLVRKLADSLPDTMPAVLDPGGTGDNFTDRYKDKWNYENFVHMINSYADRIDAAYNENDDADKSIALWRDVFGDDFKPTTKASSSLGALFKGARHRNSAAIRCEGEEIPLREVRLPTAREPAVQGAARWARNRNHRGNPEQQFQPVRPRQPRKSRCEG